MASNNTIRLHLSRDSKILEDKNAAGGNITPGEILQLDEAGGFEFPSLSTARISPIFAIENIWQGKDIDGTYAVTDKVHAVHCVKGDMVWAWLTTAQTVLIGYALAATGANGYLKSAVVGVDFTVAIAAEYVATIGEPARIKVIIV